MFTFFAFLLIRGFVAVFKGSKIEGMTHAFMVQVNRVHGEPTFVVFVNRLTNKVFLVEYKGSRIPDCYYSSVEQQCDGVFFQLIDIAKFSPREDMHNGTNSGCKALPLEYVSDDMLISFTMVYSKIMKTETKSQKAIEPQKPDVLPHRVEGKEPKRFDSAPEKNPWKDGQAKNAKQAKRKERIAILQEMLAKAKQDEKDAEEERVFKEQEEMLIKELADFGIEVSEETESA